MRINLSEILFANDTKDISKVQLLRAGESSLEITTDMLRNMKKNFDSNVRKVDCAVDYFHNSFAEAAGWIKDVVLENSDTELWIAVDWTEAAKEKILSKEIRYLSADFDMNYKDNETGIEHGPTLNGGGLTNRPFVKGMNPILSEFSAIIDNSPEKLDHIRRILFNTPKKGTEIMNFDDLKKALVSIQLSDDQKKEIARLMGIESKDVKLSEEVQVLKATVAEKDKEIVKLSDESKALKKEAEFAVLLSEGKAVPAQKEAYLTGNMAEFVKLSVPVNLSASGSGKGDEGKEAKTAAEAEEKLQKFAEEKRKADPKLSIQESIGLALSENPDLKKLLA
jgi:phage I-like protein